MAPPGPPNGPTQQSKPTERSLRAAVRRLYALASSSHHSRAGGMFEGSRNNIFENPTFIINNYGEPVPEDSRVGAGADRPSDQGTGTPCTPEEHDPSRTAIPRRESPDVYVDCLLTKNRGYPLWIPSPNTSLPELNRKRGVTYGDVGVLTPEGGFDFLFNIILDAADPINAAMGMPKDFVPFKPAVGTEFMEWTAGSYLADPSIIRVDDDSDPLKTVLEATGPEAAVLMIPEEIHTACLRVTTSLREYVEENITAWYKFVRHTLGYEIENGDLRVVYACRKSSGFGIATAFNSVHRKNTQLTFSVGRDWEGISGCPYRWSHTGSAEAKAGPPRREASGISGSESVRNQCLFVSTIDVKLSSEIWTQIIKLGTANAVDKQSEQTFTMMSLQGGSTQQPSSGSSIQRAINQPCGYYERVFHPSIILLDTLERITPGLPVYMTCDHDWADLITTQYMNAHQFVTQVLEKKIIVEHQGMAYFSERGSQQFQKCLDKGPINRIQFLCVGDPETDGVYRWTATCMEQPSRPTDDESDVQALVSKHQAEAEERLPKLPSEQKDSDVLNDPSIPKGERTKLAAQSGSSTRSDDKASTVSTTKYQGDEAPARTRRGSEIKDMKGAKRHPRNSRLDATPEERVTDPDPPATSFAPNVTPVSFSSSEEALAQAQADEDAAGLLAHVRAMPDGTGDLLASDVTSGVYPLSLVQAQASDDSPLVGTDGPASIAGTAAAATMVVGQKTANRKRQPPGKRLSQEYIPRPPNAFMLFRADFVKQKHVPRTIEQNQGSLSKIIANIWRDLPIEEQEVWKARARAERAAHNAMFPHYKLKPIHKKGKNAAAAAENKDAAKKSKKLNDEDDEDDKDENGDDTEYFSSVQNQAQGSRGHSVELSLAAHPPLAAYPYQHQHQQQRHASRTHPLQDAVRLSDADKDTWKHDEDSPQSVRWAQEDEEYERECDWLHAVVDEEAWVDAEAVRRRVAPRA